MRLSIFGTFQVADASGKEIPVKSRKARALLAYLALPPGKPRSREQIMALLWSDRGDQQARSSLRQALSGLRKDLGEERLSTLRITDEALTLDSARVIVEPAAPGDVLLDGLHLTDPAFEEWLRDERLRHEEAAVPDTRSPEPPLPDRPSIAVLPFEELGGGSEQADFSEGLAADIITELSRFGTISVVGRHESQSHDLRGATVQDVGRRLAVRYVLSGTIRRAGERMRVTAELLEVATGRPRWSERYERALDDIFAVQDEVARAIVGVVEPILHRAEMDRISRSPAENLRPHELMLRAWRLSDKGYEDGNRAAQRDCEEAIRLDPEYSDAHSLLAWILWCAATNGWTDDPEVTLQRALDTAERGWLLNSKDYDALGARGALLVALGRYDAAARIVDELAKKFPDHGHATMYQGDILSSLGRHEEALALADQSTKINPEHDQWHWMFKGTCLFCLERYAEAIDALEQFKTLSKFPYARLVLAAAYAAAGRDHEARAEVEALGPETSKLVAGVSLVYREPADRERLLMWTKRAGMPV